MTIKDMFMAFTTMTILMTSQSMLSGIKLKRREIMPKYEVLIARNETTVYTVEVDAKNEKDAETKAYKRFGKNDYEDSEVVYGEEETHEINCLEETANA